MLPIGLNAVVTVGPVQMRAHCGYPHFTKEPMDAEPKKEEDRAKGFVTNSFVKGVTEKIRRVLGKKKIITVFKQMGNIKTAPKGQSSESH